MYLGSPYNSIHNSYCCKYSWDISQLQSHFFTNGLTHHNTLWVYYTMVFFMLCQVGLAICKSLFWIPACMVQATTLFRVSNLQIPVLDTSSYGPGHRFMQSYTPTIASLNLLQLQYLCFYACRTFVFVGVVMHHDILWVHHISAFIMAYLEGR